MPGSQDSDHDLVREVSAHGRRVRGSRVAGQPDGAGGDVVGRRFPLRRPVRTGLAQPDRHPRIRPGLVLVSRQLS